MEQTYTKEDIGLIGKLQNCYGLLVDVVSEGIKVVNLGDTGEDVTAKIAQYLANPSEVALTMSPTSLLPWGTSKTEVVYFLSIHERRTIDVKDEKKELFSIIRRERQGEKTAVGFSTIDSWVIQSELLGDVVLVGPLQLFYATVLDYSILVSQHSDATFSGHLEHYAKVFVYTGDLPSINLPTIMVSDFAELAIHCYGPDVKINGTTKLVLNKN